MNKLMVASMISVLAATASSAALAEPVQPINVPELQQEAKGVIKTLATSLGGELKKAAKAEGLPAAIQVCNTKASPITAQVSKDKGWEISRTSLKLRNPANAPDAWEQKVLEQFAKQAATGANLMKVMFSEVVVDADGNKTFRMMKAIPVGDQCLACHGSKVKPQIADKLDMLYPTDKARGYKAGDLRGAFSLQKSL